MSADVVVDVGKKVNVSLHEVIRKAVEAMPAERTCGCGRATHEAQV